MSNRIKYAKRALYGWYGLGAGPTSHKERLPFLGALQWLVPEGLHVMRWPLGLTKITRQVLLELSHSLRKNKTDE